METYLTYLNNAINRITLKVSMLQFFSFFSPFLGLFDLIGRGRSASVKFYNEWIDEVKRTVPKERLLIYNVDEGWNLEFEHLLWHCESETMF